jgi:hypothetical protein
MSTIFNDTIFNELKKNEALEKPLQIRKSKTPRQPQIKNTEPANPTPPTKRSLVLIKGDFISTRSQLRVQLKRLKTAYRLFAQESH